MDKMMVFHVLYLNCCTMQTNPDVIIIGGGLAGLAGAIHLSKQGLQVTLIEKSSYPSHKVCGEYISSEILPYLDWLGVDILQLYPAKINHLEFTTGHGKAVRARLPLGGLGISRHKLDHFLCQKAIASGCTIIKDAVTAVSFADEAFAVTSQNQILTAKIVLGAYGKRSNIDQILSRDFIHKKAPWLAVKAHYSGNFPDGVVALHNFKGGYCGVSKVEDNIINICYLADFETFKKYRNIGDYQRNVLYKNKHIRSVFENSTPLFEKPLAISQISFDKKRAVENHMLMIGDTAGLIHPLCGNGMAMAMHAAKIASELVLGYCAGTIASRQLLEQAYTRQWKKHFGRRLLSGRILAKVLSHETGTAALASMAMAFPPLLPWIIKQTHGKPIPIKWP